MLDLIDEPKSVLIFSNFLYSQNGNLIAVVGLFSLSCNAVTEFIKYLVLALFDTFSANAQLIHLY